MGGGVSERAGADCGAPYPVRRLRTWPAKRKRILLQEPTMRLSGVLLLGVFWPIALLSQRAPAKPTGRSGNVASSAAAGSVEGDVYLLTKSGDVKKGAAGTVHLIRWPVKPGFAERFDSLCADESRRSREQGDADSVAREKEPDPA